MALNNTINNNNDNNDNKINNENIKKIIDNIVYILYLQYLDINKPLCLSLKLQWKFSHWFIFEIKCFLASDKRFNKSTFPTFTHNNLKIVTKNPNYPRNIFITKTNK